jgi:hypothetical protein
MITFETISRMVKALVFVPPDRMTEAAEVIISTLAQIVRYGEIITKKNWSN